MRLQYIIALMLCLTSCFQRPLSNEIIVNDNNKLLNFTPSDSRLYLWGEINGTVRSNVIMQAYLDDYTDCAYDNVDIVGVLEFTQSGQISAGYGYYKYMLSYYAFSNNGRFLISEYLHLSSVNDRLDRLRLDYEDFEFKDDLEFEEWLKLHTIMETWYRYTTYLELAAGFRELKEFDIDSLVHGMQYILGYNAVTDLAGVVTIYYEYNMESKGLYITLMYNDIIFKEWDIYIEEIDLQSMQGDIEGTIIIKQI